MISAVSFTITLGMSLVLLFGAAVAQNTNSSTGIPLLLLFLDLAICLISISIPAFIGRNAEERTKNYTYFLYGFLGWVVFAAITSAPAFFLQNSGAQKKMAQFETQRLQREAQQEQLLGKWNVTYGGETITVQFTQDDVRSTSKIPVYVINTFFYRSNSTTPFEEGAFYLSSEGDSKRTELTIRSTIPAEMLMKTAPNLPYFQFTGYITDFTADRFVYASIRSIDPRITPSPGELIFTRVK